MLDYVISVPSFLFSPLVFALGFSFEFDVLVLNPVAKRKRKKGGIKSYK